MTERGDMSGILFIACVALLVACLYIPGCLALRAFGLSRIASFACAPLLSLLFYCVLAMAFAGAGVRCSVVSVCLPALAVSLLIFAVRRFPLRGVDRLRFGDRASRGRLASLLKDDSLILAVYLIVACVLSSVIFFLFIGDMTQFAPTYDNVLHYNVIRSFADSGNWSSLDVSAYPMGAYAASASPFLGGSYYPAAWHLLGALAVTTCGAPTAVAANAVNCVVVAFVYPSSMCFLLSRLFTGKPGMVLAGAFFALAFASYPWILVFKWPLFPNALALSLVPALAGSFISLFESNMEISRRVVWAGVFVAGAFCSVFTHPNAVFTTAVFLAPFLIWRIASEAATYKRGSYSKARSAAAGMTTALFIAAIWFVCYKLPFLQGLVDFYWAPEMSVPGAFASCLELSFVASAPQWVLAVLVIVGAVYSLFHRRYLWITCSYGAACIVFVAAASLEDIPLKHLLAGFWYTDPYRAAAMSAMFAVPLASLGGYEIWSAACSAARRLKANSASTKSIDGVLAAVMAVLFLSFNFSFSCVPGVPTSGRSSFGLLADNSVGLYGSRESWVYDTEEMAFVEKVKGTIPEGSLVINQPYDGSVLAYGISGLNVYYRSLSGYGDAAESENSVLLRTGLADFESNAEVKKALVDSGAHYLLILDRDEDDLSATYGMYDGGDWAGIDDVDEETPGFTEVLHDSGMALYEIDRSGT